MHLFCHCKDNSSITRTQINSMLSWFDIKKIYELFNLFWRSCLKPAPSQNRFNQKDTKADTYGVVFLCLYMQLLLMHCIDPFFKYGENALYIFLNCWNFPVVCGEFFLQYDAATRTYHHLNTPQSRHRSTAHNPS